MTRPVTYHPAMDGFGYQASTFPQAEAYQTNDQEYFNDRPVTWHPSHSQAMLYQQHSPQYYSSIPPQLWGGSSYGQPQFQTGVASGEMSSTTLQTSMQAQYLTHRSTWFDGTPVYDTVDGNSLPMNNLNLNQHPQSTQMLPSSSYDGHQHNVYATAGQPTYYPGSQGQASSQSMDAQDDGEELVGMGLHDAATNYEQTSLLLGAGLDEHEKTPTSPMKPSLLTGELYPPEQVPDTIPDEGDDTPVTNDFHEWSTPNGEYVMNSYELPYALHPPAQHGAWGQQQQPQMYDMAGQSFLFDDPGDLPQSQWCPPIAKQQMPGDGFNMNMDGLCWMGQHGSY